MTRALKERQSDIAALCRRLGVRSLSAFGSALRDDFRPGVSDVDLLVEFEPMTPAEHARAYFALLGGLETLHDGPVDLAESAAIANPYVRREIEATRRTLYGA